MKKLSKLLSLLILLVIMFSFTGCSNSENAKYKSIELSEENTLFVDITKPFEKGQTVAPLVVNTLGENAEKVIFIGFVDVVTGTVYLNGAELPETANTGTYKAVYVQKSSVDESEESNYAFVGFLVTDKEDSSNNQLYTNKSSIVLDEQAAIFVEYDDEGNIPFPTMNVDGTNFSGWYTDSEFKAGTRVSNIEALANQEGFTGVVYARYLGYGEAAVVSVICIIIVFLMLALLWLVVALLKYINKLKKPETKKEEVVAPVVVAPRQPLKLEDIKDDDMMAAALVATIDYHEETKEDVRVVSIKEIK